jgi:hypothetical protein
MDRDDDGDEMIICYIRLLRPYLLACHIAMTPMRSMRIIEIMFVITSAESLGWDIDGEG